MHRKVKTKTTTFTFKCAKHSKQCQCEYIDCATVDKTNLMSTNGVVLWLCILLVQRLSNNNNRLYQFTVKSSSFRCLHSATINNSIVWGFFQFGLKYDIIIDSVKCLLFSCQPKPTTDQIYSSDFLTANFERGNILFCGSVIWASSFRREQSFELWHSTQLVDRNWIKFSRKLHSIEIQLAWLTSRKNDKK